MLKAYVCCFTVLVGAHWTVILYLFAVVSIRVLHHYICSEVSGAAHIEYHTNQKQKWAFSLQ